MRRFTFMATATLGLWWMLLLPGWVTTAGSSVSGTELNRTLAILPPVIVLLTLISLYGRLSRFLLLASGVITALTSLIALIADYSRSPKVIELQEMATGVAGGNGEISTSAAPIAFATVGLCASVLLMLAASKRPEQPHSTDQVIVDEQDPRYIWDEQSK